MKIIFSICLLLAASLLCEVAEGKCATKKLKKHVQGFLNMPHQTCCFRKLRCKYYDTLFGDLYKKCTAKFSLREALKLAKFQKFHLYEDEYETPQEVMDELQVLYCDLSLNEQIKKHDLLVKNLLAYFEPGCDAKHGKTECKHMREALHCGVHVVDKLRKAGYCEKCKHESEDLRSEQKPCGARKVNRLPKARSSDECDCEYESSRREERPCVAHAVDRPSKAELSEECDCEYESIRTEERPCASQVVYNSRKAVYDDEDDDCDCESSLVEETPCDANVDNIPYDDEDDDESDCGCEI